MLYLTEYAMIKKARQKMQGILDFLKDFWPYITGLVGLITSYFYIKHLILKNKKLKRENVDNSSLSEKDSALPVGTDIKLEKANSGDSNLFSNFQILFSEIAKVSLKNLSVSKDYILNLLEIECESHNILLKIDYEQLPRPLRNEIFVTLTKRSNKITIDNVYRSIQPKDFLESWNKLSRVYLESYKLPFRTNHFVLINQSEFKRTARQLQKLLAQISSYIYETRIYQEEEIFPTLHRMKKDAENNYEEANILYEEFLSSQGSEKEIGAAAIKLDTVISIAHKIIIGFHPPK